MVVDSCTTRFISKICEEDLTTMQKWESFINFLTKERRVLEEKLMVTKSDVYKFDVSRRDVPKREDGKTGYKQSCTHLSFQQHSIIFLMQHLQLT